MIWSDINLIDKIYQLRENIKFVEGLLFGGMMKNKYTVIILMCFPILTILYVNSFHLPYEVHIFVVLKILASLLLLMLLAYIVSTLLLSYIINVCRIIDNYIHGKETIQIYLFPFMYEKKRNH